jgi:hypothetical protein
MNAVASDLTGHVLARLARAEARITLLEVELRNRPPLPHRHRHAELEDALASLGRAVAASDQELRFLDPGWNPDLA